jgi:hypothetical protein
MKTEYIILVSVAAGWLVRGVVAAYRNRASLTPMQMLGTIILPNLAGGPPPEK